MKKILLLSLLAFALVSGRVSVSLAQAPRWTEERANRWYEKEPWLVGSNYTPATAINQLEMWQADTFDPKRIDLELGWAEGLGMNTMRVFLHDLLWQQDAKGFSHRIDTFLNIAARHHIKPVFVLFDSCWDPTPRLGKQRDPKPGVHNSGWVQSPGAAALHDSGQYPRLESYVKGIIGRFANDKRILAWDLWNEPDNRNDSSYKSNTDPVENLLPRTFEWARAAKPIQPLTSGVWKGDWSNPTKLAPIPKLQLQLSDIVSFHDYEPAAKFQQRVQDLKQFHRPLLCTEFMARPVGSTFQVILPIAKNEKVGAINWGFVVGKTQTNLPWDSWQHPYVDHPPATWFHDIFYPDGKPYRAEEVRLIREITGHAQHGKAAAAAIR